MDGAGRLLIAPVLRQHAGLTKEVMLVGQFNKFELWDETTWHQQVKEDIDAEQLATGDLSERLQDFLLYKMMENYKHIRCCWMKPLMASISVLMASTLMGLLVAVVTHV